MKSFLLNDSSRTRVCSLTCLKPVIQVFLHHANVLGAQVLRRFNVWHARVSRTICASICNNGIMTCPNQAEIAWQNGARDGLVGSFWSVC